jgi:hypothetical protein
VNYLDRMTDAINCCAALRSSAEKSSRPRA